MILTEFTEPLEELSLPSITKALKRRFAPTANPSSIDDRIDPVDAGSYEQEIPLARTNPATGTAYLPSEIPKYVEPLAVTQAKQDIDVDRRDQELAAELEREKKKDLMKKGAYQRGDWARARDLTKQAIPQDLAGKMVTKPGAMPQSAMQKLAKDMTSPTPSFAQSDAGRPGFSAGNIMAQPGMQKYAKSAAPAAPASTNYAQRSSGYSDVKTSAPAAFKAPGVAASAPPELNLPKVKPGSRDAEILKNLSKPGKASISTGGPNPYAKQKLATTETVKHISAMLESVKTKKDIIKIRNYINSTLVYENQLDFRAALHQKVTEVAAVKRRIAARRAAN